MSTLHCSSAKLMRATTQWTNVKVTQNYALIFRKQKYNQSKGKTSTHWSMKERQDTNMERTMTMGYFQVMERTVTMSWKGPWQCHGRNHDNVMKGAETVSWKGPWQCHGKDRDGVMEGTMTMSWRGQCHGRGHDNAMERTVTGSWKGPWQCHGKNYDNCI